MPQPAYIDPATPMLSRARIVVLALLATAACGQFKQGFPGETPGADGGPATSTDGNTVEPDGGTSLPNDDAGVGPKRDGSSAADASHGDATTSDGGGTGLDPEVTLPDQNEPVCYAPGNTTVCGGVKACRMYSPTEGRCDDCYPQGRCSGLVKSPCSDSLDCDVNLQCFRGRCTLYCSLQYKTECGGIPSRCIDVGHQTMGLCDPFQL